MLAAIATALRDARPGRRADLRADWDALAELDPLWAILSLPGRRFRRWDVDDLLATGHQQAEDHMARAHRLGHPRVRGSVLDFGCGVGRMAPGLLQHFERYRGVDVSPAMIAQAQRLHAGRDGCSFQPVAAEGRTELPEGPYDLVLSQYVLQHLPDRGAVAECLKTLAVAVSPGGLLVVQVPASMPTAEWLLYAARCGAHRVARALGMPPGWLHRLRLSPMASTTLPEERARALLASAGLVVLEVERSRGGLAIEDRVYYAGRPDTGQDEGGRIPSGPPTVGSR